MIGLNVGGNLNVGGDLVTGHQTKTVQHADGDMVVTSRGRGSSLDKVVQTAGRDMVAINRSSHISSEAAQSPGLFCPVCQEEVKANDAYCENCGEPLHPQ